MRIRILLSVSVIFFTMPCFAGQVYEWIDQNGVKHFTNEPPPPGAKIVQENKEIPYTAPKYQPPSKNEAESSENNTDMQYHETTAEPRPHDLEMPDQEHKTIEYDDGYHDGDSDRYELRERERRELEAHGIKPPEIHNREKPAEHHGEGRGGVR